MKLRNKKTGKLATFIELEKGHIIPLLLTIIDDNGVQLTLRYFTLAEFNAEWEDYKYQIPLIKNDKARKAVSAWAKANYVKLVAYDEDFNGNWCYLRDIDSDAEIRFNFLLDNTSDYRRYTITELCGEEK